VRVSFVTRALDRVTTEAHSRQTLELRLLFVLLVGRCAQQISYVAKRRHATARFVIGAHVFGVAIFADRARRKTNFLLRWIELQDFERKRLPDLHGVFGFFDSRVAQLRDVAKAFDALLDLDERAEVREAHHASLDDVAQLVSVKEAIPGVGLEVLNRQTESPAVDVNVCYDGV